MVNFDVTSQISMTIKTERSEKKNTVNLKNSAWNKQNTKFTTFKVSYEIYERIFLPVQKSHDT